MPVNKINCNVFDPWHCGVDWEKNNGCMTDGSGDSLCRCVFTLLQDIGKIGYIPSDSQFKKLKQWAKESHNHTEWGLYTINGKHKCLTIQRFPDKKRIIIKKSQ